MRIFAATVLAASLFASPVLAQDDMMAILLPGQIGQIFCMSRQGNDEGPIVGLLTAELSAAIADADKRSADWEAANPGEKPPLGDGIPWQSFPDYAPDCTVGPVTVSEMGAEVEIRYGFPEAPNADFTDVLKLKRVARTDYIDHWRIDDIGFATGGGLRSTLVDMFAGL